MDREDRALRTFTGADVPNCRGEYYSLALGFGCLRSAKLRLAKHWQASFLVTQAHLELGSYFSRPSRSGKKSTNRVYELDTVNMINKY